MFRAPCSVTIFSYLFYFKALLKITSPLTIEARVICFLYSYCKSCTSSPEMLCSTLEPMDGPFPVSVLLSGAGELWGQRRMKMWSEEDTEKDSVV